MVTSPLEETPGRLQTSTTSPGQILQSGSKQKTPLEEALLYSLEAGGGDSNEEQLTLRTFVDSRRESPHPSGFNVLSGREVADDRAGESIVSRADPLPISSSLTASDDRPTGEELSRSIGRHSIETFRTARATPANGSIREKVAETSMIEIQVEEPAITVEQEPEVDTVGVSTVGEPAPVGGVVWRLGTWVYSSMPSIRGSTAPPGGASESISVVNADDSHIKPNEPVSEVLSPLLATPQLEAPAIQTDTDALADINVAEAGQPGISASRDATNPDPPVITSWAETFRWRKGASSLAIPVASTVKPVFVEPDTSAMNQESSLGTSEAVSLPQLQPSDSPDPASTATVLSPGTSERAGQARSDGWTSYFRPRLERDPLLTALQVPNQAGAQSRDPPATSLSDVMKVDRDVSGLGAPMDVEPQENAVSRSTAPATSSRWWFRKTERQIPSSNLIEESGSIPLDQKEAVAAAKPEAEDATMDPPEPLVAPLVTPPVRLERKLSVVSRKNLVLPSWSSTFNRPPRSSVPSSTSKGENNSGIPQASLPIIDSDGKTCWGGIKRVVIIGVHGWFPNTHIQK